MNYERRVNYITELNKMYHFCMTKKPSKSEIALLYALYAINNAEDWIVWFEADNDLIQRLTGGYSREALNEARNKLKQRGRIDFKDGTRNIQKARYTIIPFVSDKEVDIQVDKEVDIQVDKEVDIQVDDIYKPKRNKTKQNNNTSSKADVNIFFETLWALYPNKQGKDSVKATQRKKLYQIGIEHMTRAVERYKEQVVGTEKQFIKHGSTFFNSGYVDFLDENYQPMADDILGIKKTNFSNFEQRDTNYDYIEDKYFAELLGEGEVET